MTSGRTGGISALFALALVLGVSAVASAATRHAAPGASGPAPCASAAPCSLFTAVSGASGGDEVIVASGEYIDTAGDLGSPAVHLIQIQPEVEVRGEAGKPRPRIVLEQGKWLGGAFEVSNEDVVAHLEITSAVASGDISQFGGTVDDLIVRNTASSAGFACTLTRGTMRDTVCLSGGANMAALGANTGGPGTLTVTLRNVTAIATGAGGVGLSYTRSDGGTITVDAKSLIALGASTDVVAEGLSSPPHTPGTGGHVTIDLDHSVYNDPPVLGTDAGNGSATVVDSNGLNVVPLLAADGYHQLKGSPTIDQGATDGASGTSDIDGQERTIGAKADVGADEFAHQTSLKLACNPPTVVLTDALPGSGTDCTATVTDLEAGVLPLTGTVSFSSSGGKGEFTQLSCTLSAPGLSNHATCAVNYKPKIGSAGSHTVTAAFPGDGTHDGSQGTASVTVTESPFGCAGPAETCQAGRPTVRIEKKPARKTAKRLATFTFSSNQASARFECSLDKKAFKACRSPFKHRVKPGHHSFAVRAVGSGGTSKPATYRWRVINPTAR